MSDVNFTCPNCGGDSFQEIVLAHQANFIEVEDVIDGKPVFSSDVWDSKSLDGDEHQHYECCRCLHEVEAYSEPEPAAPPKTIDPVTYAAAAAYAPHVPSLADLSGQEGNRVRTILAFSQQPHYDPIYEGAFGDVAELVLEHGRLESHPTTVVDISQPPATAHVDFATKIEFAGLSDLSEFMDVDLDAESDEVDDNS